MNFRDPTHWSATKAATPPSYGVPIGILQWVYPELGLAAPAAAAQPSAAGQAQQGQPSAVGQPSGAAASIPGGLQPSVAAQVQPSGPDAAQPASSGGTSVLGMGLGALALLLGVAYIVAKRRERGARRPDVEPAAKWPDKEHV